MTFSDSIELLRFHWVAYSTYCLLIISVIAWFAWSLTRKEKAKRVVRIPFYGYIAFLVVAGVGHHILTYNTIPWVVEDINRHNIRPDKVFEITVKDHRFILPEEKMVVRVGERVLFDVTSEDLIYGFGLFREDGTMVTQMQVNPGSRNDLLWRFHRPGVLDLMSTEYSGPAQYDEQGRDIMKVPQAVVVLEREEGPAS